MRGRSLSTIPATTILQLLPNSTWLLKAVLTTAIVATTDKLQPTQAFSVGTSSFAVSSAASSAFNGISHLHTASVTSTARYFSSELSAGDQRQFSTAVAMSQKVEDDDLAINSKESPPDSSINNNNSNDNVIPNWRSIPPESDNWNVHLSERPAWSDEQFQESLELYNRFMDCSDTYVAPIIQDALNCLDHAYRLYGPQSVIGSFNGGKDAVVIMHLMRAAHAKHYNNTHNNAAQDADPITRPRVIYFDHPDEFPQVKEFLHECVQSLDLDMLAFEQGTKFSQGLEILVGNNHLKDCGTTSWPMSFVLGTRADDPNAGGQGAFAPSSHYMPPFMRVNPVLDWSYGHVWHFLRLFHLPYCDLYDQGYTSLGTTKDTMPCPALLVPTGSRESLEATDEAETGLPKYWPAYMLGDWSQERAGRIKKSKPGAKNDKPSKSSKPAPKKIGAPSSPAPERHSSTASDFRQSDPMVMLEAETEQANASDEDGSSSDSDHGDIVTNMPTTPAGSRINAPAVSSLYDDSTAFTLDSDADSVTQKSVGILIIGDEILKGLTMDQNTHAAAIALRAQNVLLSRVVVVSDTPEEIVEEIQRLQDEVDVIITSGGVGPTHDDVTIKSVASALGRDMVLHDEMADLLREKMNIGNQTGRAQDGNKDFSDLTEAQVKMATLPTNAKLRYLSDVANDWPVLQCRNIFILPGVPEFFAKKIENVARYLSSQLERSIGYKVVLGVEESVIVDILNEVVGRHPNVSFGSYPFVSHPEFQTVLTLEGNLLDDAPTMSPIPARNSTVFTRSAIVSSKEQRDRYVQLALEHLIQKLPKGSILRVDNDDLTPFT